MVTLSVDGIITFSPGLARELHRLVSISFMYARGLAGVPT